MKLWQMVFITVAFTASLFAQSRTYLNYEGLKEHLERIADDHSELTKLESLGTTALGRQMLVLELGAGQRDSKAAILLVAGVTATDLCGTEILLHFIDSTLQTYGTDKAVTEMLNNTTFYIFPRVSPDASESLFLAPAYQRSLNGREMDLDKDGQKDEDGFEDLNGDGFITTMRVRESVGSWLEDPQFPPLLKPAEAVKNEVGEYSLYTEGIDNDGDGLVNEDEPGGTDFNKNFTYQYNLFEKGAGPHQISEIETRAVADFAFSHPNIAVVFTFSDNDNLVNPWESNAQGNSAAIKGQPGKPFTEVVREDAPYYKSVSDSFKTITGFNQTGRPAEKRGAFSEWAYYHFGRWSFSTPAWVPPAVTETGKDSTQRGMAGEPKTDIKPAEKKANTYDQRLWMWLKAAGLSDSFIPWQEINHPDFPGKKVEVGGFRPLSYTNPPLDSLTHICQMYQPFFLKLAGWLPRISIEELSTERLNENVYRLTVNVVNKGYLPSNPQAAAANQWAAKVKVSVSVNENQQIASGKHLTFIEGLPGGGSKPVSWVIISKPGQTVGIEAGSPMTGVIKKSIRLE